MLHLFYQSISSLGWPEGCGFVVFCVYKCLSLGCRDVYETWSIRNRKSFDEVMWVHTNDYIKDIFPFLIMKVQGNEW